MQKKDSQESAHICIIDTTFERVGKGKTTIFTAFCKPENPSNVH